MEKIINMIGEKTQERFIAQKKVEIQEYSLKLKCVLDELYYIHTISEDYYERSISSLEDIESYIYKNCK